MTLHAISASLLGCAMGLLTPLAPDHLCSLIALNMTSADSTWSAFRGGVQWGLGHSTGIILFCLIFLPLQTLIDVSVWEKFGHYFAGFLLIAIGFYFLVFESRYLERRLDGTWAPRSCACHGHGQDALGAHGHIHSHAHVDHHDCGHGHCQDNGHHHGHDRAFSNDHDHPHSGDCGHRHHNDDEESVRLPLLKKEMDDYRTPSERRWDVKTAVVGLLQGLCCPSCIAGLAFVGQMGYQRPVVSEVILFLTSLLISILSCSALVSVLVVILARNCTYCCSVSTRTTYRAACILTIGLGIVWIILHCMGMLHVLEYTDNFSHHLHRRIDAPMKHVA